MKIKIIKAWINIKCCECGEIIYPDNVYKVKPEKIINNLAEWNLHEKCFNRLFSEEIRKKVK